MPTSVANVVAKSVTGMTGATPGTAHTRQVLPVNVGETERLVSMAGGAALLGYGLTCRGLAGVLLPLAGGALVLRGMTGWCGLYQALGVDTHGEGKRGAVKAGHGFKVEEAVTVNRPARDLFAFWRQLDNLPRFMNHLKSVTMLGGNRSHWVARGPAGVSVEWDAEIHNERVGEMIAWRSLPGSDVDTAGSVHFVAAPGGGTEIRVSLKYVPPAGKVGAWVASLFGDDARQAVRADLQRFKELMESGNRLPTTPGPRTT